MATAAEAEMAAEAAPAVGTAPAAEAAPSASLTTLTNMFFCVPCEEVSLDCFSKGRFVSFSGLALSANKGHSI